MNEEAPQTPQDILTPKQELGLGVTAVIGGAAITFAGVEVSAPIEVVTGLVVIGVGSNIVGKALGKLHILRSDTSNPDK